MVRDGNNKRFLQRGLFLSTTWRNSFYTCLKPVELKMRPRIDKATPKTAQYISRQVETTMPCDPIVGFQHYKHVGEVMTVAIFKEHSILN